MISDLHFTAQVPGETNLTNLTNLTVTNNKGNAAVVQCGQGSHLQIWHSLDQVPRAGSTAIAMGQNHVRLMQERAWQPRKWGWNGQFLGEVEFLAGRVQENTAQSPSCAGKVIPISMALDSLGLLCSNLLFPERQSELCHQGEL